MVSGAIGAPSNVVMGFLLGMTGCTSEGHSQRIGDRLCLGEFAFQARYLELERALTVHARMVTFQNHEGELFGDGLFGCDRFGKRLTE
jgi:hypothetical protein